MVCKCSRIANEYRRAREKDLTFKNGSAIETIKMLGLLWDLIDDNFGFGVGDMSDKIEGPTKRRVLSALAKLYDPLGLIGPVILLAKMLMQDLLRLKLDWDEPLPVLSSTNTNRIEIHGFADASLKAYGACIYIYSWSDDKPHMSLLCSKSKVAPIKADAAAKKINKNVRCFENCRNSKGYSDIGSFRSAKSVR